MQMVPQAQMAAAMTEGALDLQQLQRQVLGQQHASAAAPAAAFSAAAVMAAAPAVSAAVEKDVDDRSELEEYRYSVDEEAKKAAGRSSKKYAREPDAYLRDEFQKAGREKVRLAEKKWFRKKPKELKKLRKRRGQPEETNSSGSSSSSSGSDSSDSSDSDSSGSSESDEVSKGRSRKRKRGSQEKSKVDFKRFRRGRARSKGRSKPEKQAKEFFSRHFESNRARWQTTRNEAEGRRLHALRVMMAQLLATTATREEMVRAVTKTIEAMTEALETYDNERGLDTHAKVNGLESAIVKAAGKQAEQFGKEMRKIITVPRSATAHRGYDHGYDDDDWA